MSSYYIVVHFFLSNMEVAEILARRNGRAYSRAVPAPERLVCLQRS